MYTDTYINIQTLEIDRNRYRNINLCVTNVFFSNYIFYKYAYTTCIPYLIY